jgi:hypothetical protein
MMKTSAPRTFSLICTKISPSEKRETSQAVKGSPKNWAIFSANGRFAVPVNSFSRFAIFSFPKGAKYNQNRRKRHEFILAYIPL